VARTFNGTSDKITLRLGALGFAFGPGTIAALLRVSSLASNRHLFSVGVSSGARHRFSVMSTGVLRLACDGNTADSAATVATARWYLVAVTKASGSVAPRFHFYDIAANTWTHQDSGSAIANSSVPITEAKIGCDIDHTGFYAGDIGVLAEWDVALTDAQVESLPFGIGPWLTPGQPKALLVLDQAAVTQAIPDLSGNGSNQSAIAGTTVTAASVPLWTPTEQGHGVVLAGHGSNVIPLPLSGAITPTGALTKQAMKMLGGSLRFFGSLRRRQPLLLEEEGGGSLTLRDETTL